MDLLQYVRAELLILIPVLYLIGMALKKSKLKDSLIPFVLGAISIALCALWVLANSEIHSSADLAAAAFSAVSQGILVAGASVYANQLYKQFNKKDGD